MKTSKVLILMLGILLIGSLSTSLAQSFSQSKGETPLTIIGTLKCSSCELKKEKDAGSQCSIYGCQFSFKTEKITDASGKRVKKYEGKTYHILLNDNSKDLVHKEHKKRKYEIKGKIYDGESVLEVSSFSELKEQK